MLRKDGQLPPGMYRITLDDGRTGDYELSGHSQRDNGDYLSFQPTTVGEVALDSELAVGHVIMAVSEDGHVWRIPGNRLADAELVEQEDINRLAKVYLAQAPFYPPTERNLWAAEEMAFANLPLPGEAVQDREDEAWPEGNPRRIPETSGVSEPITPGTYDPKVRSRRPTGTGPAAPNYQTWQSIAAERRLAQPTMSGKDQDDARRQASGMQIDERTAAKQDHVVSTGETPPAKFGEGLSETDADKMSMLEMSPPPGSPPDPLVAVDAMPSVAMPGERPFDDPSQDASGLFSDTSGVHDAESPDANMESESAKTIEGTAPAAAPEPELTRVEAAQQLNEPEAAPGHSDHAHATETLRVDDETDIPNVEDQAGR